MTEPARDSHQKFRLIKMKYSVIIATYNRADDLRETLRSIAGLSPSGAWEVIVVDNNSKDHTKTVVSGSGQVVSRRASLTFLKKSRGDAPR